MSHSVELNIEKCAGCTACVKVCPTEAIRVVRSKAVIFDQRCIDCGRCVSVCPHHAYSVKSDSFDKLKDYAYNIAIPDTALYGQFKNLYDINLVHEGLIMLGFQDVYPSAIGRSCSQIITRSIRTSSFRRSCQESIPNARQRCGLSPWNFRS